MAEPVVETQKLTKIFLDFWGRKKKVALRALDIKVNQGEIFGLLGPNGSGKTTTIKLLLGLLFPTEGRATVMGKSTTDVRKNELIGYLPEESYLYRFSNAEETLDFYGRLFDLPASVRVRRAQELIDRVGLGRDKKRQLREYSKGMRQRIGLAQALINDPKLVILDEPTSGLDPLAANEFAALIGKLRTEGMAILMVTHDLFLARQCGVRIGVMARGRLASVFDASDVDHAGLERAYIDVFRTGEAA